jgi:hypothetical protein
MCLSQHKNKNSTNVEANKASAINGMFGTDSSGALALASLFF